jgi:hypothetical protein
MIDELDLVARELSWDAVVAFSRLAPLPWQPSLLSSGTLAVHGR